MDNNCIFCKIINGEIPSAKVYEDEEFLGFMDINPAVRDHTLVIPKYHCRNILDTPENVGKNFYNVISKVSNAVKKAFNAEGIYVFQQNVILMCILSHVIKVMILVNSARLDLKWKWLI